MFAYKEDSKAFAAVFCDIRMRPILVHFVHKCLDSGA